jgi:hypothetical protein
MDVHQCHARKPSTDKTADHAVTERPDDILPLSRPELLGLPFKRRVLGRRIAAGDFPEVLRFGRRLYVTRADCCR